MKRLSTILILAICLTAAAHAQESVDFEIHYSPNLKYDETIDVQTFLHVSMTEHTDSATAPKETSNNRSMGFKHEIAVSTGPMRKDGASFPLRAEVVRMSDSLSKLVYHDGMVFYGYDSTGAPPVIDSTDMTGAPGPYYRKVLMGMQGMISKSSFPGGKLKPGETLSKDSLITMPIPYAGKIYKAGFILTTDHRLDSVRHGIAYFSVRMHSRKISHDPDAVAVDGSIEGDGALDYDIAHSFHTRYESTVTMSMKAKIDGKEYGSNSHITNRQKVVISPNR